MDRFEPVLVPFAVIVRLFHLVCAILPLRQIQKSRFCPPAIIIFWAVFLLVLFFVSFESLCPPQEYDWVMAGLWIDLCRVYGLVDDWFVPGLWSGSWIGLWIGCLVNRWLMHGKWRLWYDESLCPLPIVCQVCVWIMAWLWLGYGWIVTGFLAWLLECCLVDRWLMHGKWRLWCG